MFSQQDTASLKCLHTHWQLISTVAANIIISTVTSKGRLQDPISPVCAQGTSMFSCHPSHCQGGLLYTQSQNGCHVQQYVLYIPIIEVTFSLRASTLTHILRFEYIVNTL